MKISILISAYKGRLDLPLLMSAIERLRRNDHEVEVIVRDDHSSDGTADLVEKSYPWCTLLRGERNLGFVRSMNLAFRASSGEVVCCLNQDTVPGEEFLLEGVAALQREGDIAGVNTNMIMPWIMSLEEYGRTPPENMPAREYQLSRYGFAQYASVTPETRFTNFMTGGAFFLRRSAISSREELFDPDLFMYCEDTELSLRVQSRGGRIAYSPHAMVYHNQVAKRLSGGTPLKRLLQITWSRFLVMAKYDRPLKLLKNYPLYCWGTILKMGHLGLDGQKKKWAFAAGTVTGLLFLFLLPCFFWKSVHFAPFRQELLRKN